MTTINKIAYEIIAVAIIFLVSSCNMQRWCSKHYPAIASTDTVRDSSVVYQKHDSTIYIPADSSWVGMYIECDKNGKAWLRELNDYRAGKYMGLPKVIIKDNYLTAQCKADTIAIGIYWFNKYVRTNVKTKTVAVKIINEPNGWGWVQIWCGRIFMGIVVLVLLWVILKFAIKVNIPFLK